MTDPEPGDRGGPPLVVEAVSKAFGGIHAVRDVSFSVRPAEVVALAGENGAGKSTLKNMVTGLIPPDTGRVHLRDGDSPTSTIHARELGILAVHQEFSLFPSLTVTENVFLFGRRRTGPKLRGAALDTACRELLTEIGAGFSPDALVAELSPAEQQLVEIVKALAQDPEFLVLDEPTASLNLAERERIHGIVRTLRDRGVGIIYITHHLEEIFELSDRTVVLRDGRQVADRPTSELNRRSLEELMVGRAVQELERPHARVGDRVRLRVSDVTDGFGSAPVSFEVRAGEIFGLAGLVGSGRSELAQAIFGLRPRTGRVWVDDVELTHRHPRRAKAAGLAFVTEDRRHEGLFLDRSIAENLSVTTLSSWSQTPVGWLRGSRERSVAHDLIERLGVRGAHRLDAAARSLSGGNQQKLVIGKWLATSPRVFILDEPTRGIDVGAKAEVHQVIRELAESGSAVVLISSDLPEVLGLSHRVGVMHERRLAAVLDHDAADPARVIRLATGGED